MLKRLLFVLLCLVTACCLTSCAVATGIASGIVKEFRDTINEKKIDENEFVESEPVIVPQYTAQPYDFPVLKGEFNSVKRMDYIGYTHLNDAQKHVYDSMYNAAQRMDKAVFSVGKCTGDDIAVAIQALLYDCPQLVWVPNEYVITEFDNGSLGLSFYSPERNIDYLYSSESARNGVLDAMYQEIDSFVDSNIKPSMSQLEIEIAVHDWICNLIEYDETAAESAKNGTDSKYFSAWNPIGAILNKKAVCAGYAKSFQLVLNYLGINCVGIRAISDEEMHMLNAAEIDGDWYYVDPTWDDQNLSTLKATHSYFNLSYRQISKTHQIFKDWETVMSSDSQSHANFNIFLPECTREDYNYFSYNNTMIKSEELFESVVMDNLLRKSYRNNKGIEFQITYGEIDDKYLLNFIERNDISMKLNDHFRFIKSIEYAALDNGVFFIKINRD